MDGIGYEKFFVENMKRVIQFGVLGFSTDRLQAG